jgi:hypothetical protein
MAENKTACPEFIKMGGSVLNELYKQGRIGDFVTGLTIDLNYDNAARATVKKLVPGTDRTIEEAVDLITAPREKQIRQETAAPYLDLLRDVHEVLLLIRRVVSRPTWAKVRPVLERVETMLNGGVRKIPVLEYPPGCTFWDGKKIDNADLARMLIEKMNEPDTKGIGLPEGWTLGEITVPTAPIVQPAETPEAPR